MWVTSTYLGKPDPDARVFVYFFWEDYAHDSAAPSKLAEYLRKAGNLFGTEATFLVPHPEDADRITHEINEGGLKRFRNEEIKKYSPCLLMTRKPLDEFDPKRDPRMFFSVPHANDDDQVYQAFFAELHKHVAATRKMAPLDDTSFLTRVWNAIDLSPNFAGMGVNLKKLVSPRSE